MCDFKAGECCWCNCGKYSGIVLSLFCIGLWCLKAETEEEVSHQCCYCYDWIGFGCNCFWLGCVCCVPEVAKEIKFN